MRVQRLCSALVITKRCTDFYRYHSACLAYEGSETLLKLDRSCRTTELDPQRTFLTLMPGHSLPDIHK